MVQLAVSASYDVKKILRNYCNVSAWLYVAAIWVQIPKKFLSFGVHEVPFRISRNSTSAC
jgi:hypothetical protein